VADLDKLNLLLKAEDNRLTADFESPNLPVCFIMEMGRCGSTVFIQALANSLRIGYVGRVLAKHWLAPYIGALMEREILKPEDIEEFDYTYQKTMGPHEPNEWGWFWQHWLCLARDETYRTPEHPAIDRIGLLQKLAAIEHIKQAPLVFDNVYAKANMAELLPILPKVLFIHLVRDPYFVCNSHINARIDKLGDLNRMYGHPPRDVKEILEIEDPVEQVVRQMKSVCDELAATMSLVDASQIFTVSYPDMVQDMGGVMDRVAEFLESHGAQIERKPKTSFPGMINRNTPDVVRPEFKEALNLNFRTYFG